MTRPLFPPCLGCLTSRWSQLRAEKAAAKWTAAFASMHEGPVVEEEQAAAHEVLLALRPQEIAVLTPMAHWHIEHIEQADSPALTIAAAVASRRANNMQPTYEEAFYLPACVEEDEDLDDGDALQQPPQQQRTGRQAERTAWRRPAGPAAASGGRDAPQLQRQRQLPCRKILPARACTGPRLLISAGQC